MPREKYVVVDRVERDATLKSRRLGVATGREWRSAASSKSDSTFSAAPSQTIRDKQIRVVGNFWH